ncbi:aldo/keto reductase [Rhodococcus sp. NPDC003382]|uniref:aldo/keto reductase n=1 Tax=unclassified Rhodococcus (in: high G+C Gram-positive bacteria) TaxID=192944 RepID=UPI0018CF6233|nr:MULTISPECIES: aldo/keto reductase [unclassified Rhodococcus (in: high G+C Gram-positive bacteria)]MBH0123018.1 aldo/keto reductase [Rhodococcus sp. CX]MCK8669898.1 aldo/keto reductase [Rhodococcus sp. HM1]
MTVANPVPNVTLDDGNSIPQIGFGVWQVPDDECFTAVTSALTIGYRSIDTAAIYGNEVGTGRAIAAAGVPRDELFVTTKLWNSADGPWTRDRVFTEFDASLDRLGLDYVDLYLIHWPRPMREDYRTIWQAFTELKADGRARSIGVSNFQPEQLRTIIADTGVVPVINQIEVHPDFAQTELRRVHDELGIVTEAWSPLGQGRGLLDDPTLARIALEHDRSPAQVVLRWHLQIGNVAIPKSVTPHRIRQNLDVFDFELDAAELDAISALDTGNRLGGDPATFDVG